MLLASPCSTPQPLSHGIVQYRLARELVAPVFRLDETGYYLAAVLVQHLKEDTIFAVVHALCRGLVVHFFLGELFLAAHLFLPIADMVDGACRKRLPSSRILRLIVSALSRARRLWGQLYN